MSRGVRVLGLSAASLVAAATVVVLVLSLLSPGKSGSESDLDSWPSVTLTAEGGGVEVEATWLSEDGRPAGAATEYPLDRYVLIRIAFTTHSGDLRLIDIQRSAELKQSGARMAPEAWISLSDDSHHRAGVLVFARGDGGNAGELVLAMEQGPLSFVWQGFSGG